MQPELISLPFRWQLTVLAALLTPDKISESFLRMSWCPRVWSHSHRQYANRPGGQGSSDSQPQASCVSLWASSLQCLHGCVLMLSFTHCALTVEHSNVSLVTLSWRFSFTLGLTLTLKHLQGRVTALQMLSFQYRAQALAQTHFSVKGRSVSFNTECHVVEWEPV